MRAFALCSVAAWLTLSAAATELIDPAALGFGLENPDLDPAPFAAVAVKWAF